MPNAKLRVKDSPVPTEITTKGQTTVVVTGDIETAFNHDMPGECAAQVALLQQKIAMVQRELADLYKLVANAEPHLAAEYDKMPCRAATLFWQGGALMSDRELTNLTQRLVGKTAKYYGSDWFICETISSAAAERLARILGATWGGVRDTPKPEGPDYVVIER